MLSILPYSDAVVNNNSRLTAVKQTVSRENRVLFVFRRSDVAERSVYTPGAGLTPSAAESVTVADGREKHTMELTPLAMGWAKSEDRLGFTAAAAHFFECVRQDRTPLTCPQDALKTHALLNRILRSAGLPAMD